MDLHVRVYIETSPSKRGAPTKMVRSWGSMAISRIITIEL